MRVRGIRIGAHWSWLGVFVLIWWSLGRRVFPLAYPGLADRSYLVMGLVSAVVFFVCILLHELGHAFRALKEDMLINDITLWLFGGVARFKGMFPSARAEFRIAVAGPVVSFVLVAVFAVLTWLGGMAGLPLEVRGVFDYLARINLLVVVFNLVPALPLDGGRILRAWLWSRKGNFTQATVSAARVGKGFAYLLMGIGAFELVSSYYTGGIWLIVMGLFLSQAAGAEQNYAVIRRAFQDMTVRDLMTPDPAAVPSTMTVEEFLKLVQAQGHSTYPVVDDGELKGLVSLRMAAEVLPERRSRTSVADLMTEALVLDGAAPVVEVIEPLRMPPSRALVVDGGRVKGILSISDVVKALEIRQATAGRPPARKRRARTVVLAAIAFLLPFGAVVYRPPVVVLSPAPAIDVSNDVTIDGVPLTELSGRYMLVAVHVSRPNAIRAAIAYLNPDVHVMAQRRVLPEGVSQADYLRGQRRVFEESRQAAAAAAAQAAGLQVGLDGAGALVIDVVEDTPSDGKLRPGDVIVAVGDTPVRLVADLVGLTTGSPAGTEFEFTVERGSETETISLKSARLRGFNTANTGIGIVTTTRDLDVQLPFEVEFTERAIGGPSAGLIYALAIADMLDAADVAGSRDIAASGTIQLDGRVGAVGGLREKLTAAEGADVDVFLVPRSELGDVPPADRRGRVSIQGVETLEEAMEILNGRA